MLARMTSLVLAGLLFISVTLAWNGKYLSAWLNRNPPVGKRLSPREYSHRLEGMKIDTTFLLQGKPIRESSDALHAVLLLSDNCVICREHASSFQSYAQLFSQFGMPFQSFLFSLETLRISETEYMVPVTIVSEQFRPKEVTVLPALLVLQRGYIVKAFVGPPGYNRKDLLRFLLEVKGVIPVPAPVKEDRGL